MIRILILTLIILNNCGKKGDLYLDGRESNTIIEIDEERIYKFWCTALNIKKIIYFAKVLK